MSPDPGSCCRQPEVCGSTSAVRFSVVSHRRAYATPPADGDRRGRSPRPPRSSRARRTRRGRGRGQAVEESGGEQVAGARRVDHGVHRYGRHLDTSSSVITTHPSAPVVIAAKAHSAADRGDRLVERGGLVQRDSSSWFPNSRSTLSRTSERKSSRWRSTQNESDNVSDTIRPCAWATSAARRNASLASGRSYR